MKTKKTAIADPDLEVVDDKPRPYGDTRPAPEVKRPKTFRFGPEFWDKLALATEKFDCSETYYVELALRNQFRKDGIE